MCDPQTTVSTTVKRNSNEKSTKDPSLMIQMFNVSQYCSNIPLMLLKYPDGCNEILICVGLSHRANKGPKDKTVI